MPPNKGQPSAQKNPKTVSHKFVFNNQVLKGDKKRKKEKKDKEKTKRKRSSSICTSFLVSDDTCTSSLGQNMQSSISTVLMC